MRAITIAASCQGVPATPEDLAKGRDAVVGVVNDVEAHGRGRGLHRRGDLVAIGIESRCSDRSADPNGLAQLRLVGEQHGLPGIDLRDGPIDGRPSEPIVAPSAASSSVTSTSGVSPVFVTR